MTETKRSDEMTAHTRICVYMCVFMNKKETKNRARNRDRVTEVMIGGERDD